jgi:hypothetical protein
LKSLNLVATQAGLRVKSVTYDSSAFQFWGSELYRRDIPLNDRRSQEIGGTFTARQIATFEARARALNKLGLGDQIVALLVAAD